MKKIAAFLLIYFCVSTTNAQINTQGTVYFTKDWDTCFKDVAYYTRVWKKEDKAFSVVDYYPNGKTQMTGTFDLDSPKKKQGYFKYFNEDGFITSEGNYVNSKKEGLWKLYKGNGLLWLEEEISKGENNGVLKTYFEDGTLKRTEWFKDNEFVGGKCFSRSGADTMFYPLREKPKFIGGETKMYQFIQDNLRYPPKAAKAKIQGTVRVLFAVDTDGSLKEIKVKKAGNLYLDEEAMRVINSMPNWKPGKSEGEPVKTYYAIPITFKLDNNSK